MPPVSPGFCGLGVERKRSKANEEAWHRTRRPEICMSKGAQRVDSYYPQRPALDRRVYPAAAVIFRLMNETIFERIAPRCAAAATKKAARLTPGGGVTAPEWMGQHSHVNA
jgi:hypothetical protein